MDIEVRRARAAAKKGYSDGRQAKPNTVVQVDGPSAYVDAFLKAVSEVNREAKDRATVAGGKCPSCGASLRRNLSLTGWWQCEQVGADTHRKDPSKPSCNWQAFVIPSR